MSRKKIVPTIFLHIPKTGGNTLHTLLHRLYPKSRTFSCWYINDTDRIDALSPEEKEDLLLIKGHIRLEIAQRVPYHMYFFTLLREPIARTISLYYYIKRFKTHRHHHEIVDNNYTLQQVLEKGIVRNMDNCQVRFLASAHDVPYGEINEMHYRKALENLDHLMHAYGLVEYYDESLLIFQDAFSWNTPYYASNNVTKKKEKAREHPIAMIEQYNKYDLMLYAYAKKKFLAELESRGPEFQERVRRFKRINRWISLAVKVKRKIFREPE